jgi:hypothetical protein
MKVKLFDPSWILAGLALLSIAGCATQAQVGSTSLSGSVTVPSSATDPVVTPTPTARSEIDAKLDNATAIAQAGNDPAGMSCWPTLKAWVDTLPSEAADPVLPAAIGLSGETETLRIKAKAAQARLATLKSIVQAGIPDNVVSACAVVVTDAKVLAAKILAIVGLAVGL